MTGTSGNGILISNSGSPVFQFCMPLKSSIISKKHSYSSAAKTQSKQVKHSGSVS